MIGYSNTTNCTGTPYFVNIYNNNDVDNNDIDYNCQSINSCDKYLQIKEYKNNTCNLNTK